MKEIFRGVYNHHIKGETELSEERMKICKECEFSTKSIVGLRCTICTCPCKYRTKSNKNCPKDKW